MPTKITQPIKYLADLLLTPNEKIFENLNLYKYTFENYLIE